MTKPPTLHTIKDVKTGQTFRGYSISSIARRVWGRDAVVSAESEVKGRYEILGPPMPSNPRARQILARIYAEGDVPFDHHRADTLRGGAATVSPTVEVDGED